MKPARKGERDALKGKLDEARLEIIRLNIQLSKQEKRTPPAKARPDANSIQSGTG